MQEKARQSLSRSYRVGNLEKAKNLLEKRARIVEFFWCGGAECGHAFDESVNVSLLETPADGDKDNKGACMICGKNASTIVRLAIAC